ncbi:PTS transporter subunit EIIC [Megamonas funiformis]
MNYRLTVQKFGGFLAGMVLPNIGAFIAWGLLTALFLDSGWLPNKELATLIKPILQYMLPLIIAYTGGKMVYGQRGSVAGVVAASGAIFGTELPMFMGAMILGPLGGMAIKYVDKLLENHIPTGFEMLVNNFSIGILGVGTIVCSFYIIGPSVQWLTQLANAQVDAIIASGAMPLLAVIIEPAKVLFLNNAIDQGIFVPLGAAEILEKGGKTIYYMLVSSPAPGAGVLLAYWFFGKGESKEAAPSTLLIQFIGGIHEVYFPYVLMNPLMFLAVIAGGIAQIFVWVLLKAGLAGYPHPGSVISFIIMLPKEGAISVLIGLLAGIIASCVVASLILRFTKMSNNEDIKLSDDFSKMLGINTDKSDKVKVQNTTIKEKKENLSYKTNEIDKIIFACDAGVGSSVMGSSILKKKIKNAGYNIEVTHSAVDQVPNDTKVIVTQQNLEMRARVAAPNAVIYTVKNFINDPTYEKLLKDLKDGNVK